MTQRLKRTLKLLYYDRLSLSFRRFLLTHFFRSSALTESLAQARQNTDWDEMILNVNYYLVRVSEKGKNIHLVVCRFPSAGYCRVLRLKTAQKRKMLSGWKRTYYTLPLYCIRCFFFFVAPPTVNCYHSKLTLNVWICLTSLFFLILSSVNNIIL